MARATHSRDEKRARILEAALTLCERSGIEGARMDEVAALAQVSKGTLYNFFESKEDLFLATLIDSYQGAVNLGSQQNLPVANASRKSRRNLAFAPAPHGVT